jgi:hypothetical protein
MKENETEKKEDNSEEGSKNHFQWLNDFRHALREDFNKKIRKVKTWLEIAAFAVVVTYTYVSCNQWKTAEKQLEVSERPWIGSTIRINKQAMNGPLRTAYYMVSLEVILQNYGKSPATKVGIGIESKTFHLPSPTQWENSSACQDADRNSGDPSRNEVVFPGVPLAKPYGISLRDLGENQTQLGVRNKMLVACLAYEWTATNTKYHTRMVFIGEPSSTAPDPIPCPDVPTMLCKPLVSFEQYHADEW